MGEFSLHLVLNDITEVSADAVVNAANAQLIPGGGIDDAIRKAAGNLLTKETEAIRECLQGRSLGYGEVVSTEPYNFSRCKKKILHVAGPDIRPLLASKKKHTRIQEHHLRMTYFNILKFCEEEELFSVAIPFISIGIFGYPREEGIRVAFQSILAYFETHDNTKVGNVTLVTKDAGVHNLALKILQLTNVCHVDINQSTCVQMRRIVENVEKRQLCTMPVGYNLKVASFVKKWGDKNEEMCIKKMVENVEELRKQNAVYMKLYRQSSQQLREREAELKQQRRLEEGNKGRHKGTQRMIAMRKNPDYVHQERTKQSRRRYEGGEEGRRKNAERMSRTRGENPELVCQESSERQKRRMQAGEDERLKNAQRMAIVRNTDPDYASREKIERQKRRSDAGTKGRLENAKRMAMLRNENPSYTSKEITQRQQRRIAEGDDGRNKNSRRMAEYRLSNSEYATSENKKRRQRRLRQGEKGRFRNASRMAAMRIKNLQDDNSDSDSDSSNTRPRLTENISRTERRRSRFCEQENRNVDVQIKSLKRQLPKVRDRENLVRKIRTSVKANLFGAPHFIVKTGQGNVEICRTGKKTVEIREHMNLGTRLLRDVIGLINRKKDAQRREKFKSNLATNIGLIQKTLHLAMSSNSRYKNASQAVNRIRRKYGFKKKKTITGTINSLGNQYKSLIDHKGEKAALNKRTLLAVDYLLIRGKLKPTQLEQKHAILKCNMIHTTAAALREIAIRKVEGTISKLIGYAKAKAEGNRTFASEHEKAIFEMGGGHLHVKTHELNVDVSKNTKEYRPVQSFYPEFVEQLMEKGYCTPSKVGEPREVPAVPTKKTTTSDLLTTQQERSPTIDDRHGAPSKPVEIRTVRISDSESSAESGSRITSSEEEGNEENDSESSDEEEAPQKETLVRYGDGSCENEDVMKIDWPTKLRASILGLLNLKSPNDVYVYVRDNSECDICKSDQTCKVDNCKSILRLLRDLEPHYRTVRLILRCWYHLRQHSRWLAAFEDAEKVKRPSFKKYQSLLESGMLSSEMRAYKAKIEVKECVDDSPHLESSSRERHAKIMDQFNSIIGNLEIHPCKCCLRVFKTDKICKVRSSDSKLPEFLKDSEGADDIIICKECKDQIKKDKIPDVCVKNGLELDEIPEELQRLNWLELLLIRKIRPMMCTFQLKNAKGGTHGTHRAYKGTVLHVPVPIQETWNHVVNKLPSTKGVIMRVLVENKEGLSREHFVNPENEDLEKEMNEAGIPDAGNTNQVREHLLTFVDTTTSAATHVNPKPPEGQASDIYMKLKKMKGESVLSSEKHLEEQCFPEIFPKGRGALQSKRNRPITWVRYIRRNLRLSDRRFINDNYAIVMNNMQDIKTLINSININAKKMMKSSDFLAKMDAGQIDSELSTVFRALRSHNDYWKERRKELKTMIKYFGPPTLFITVNPAENEWKELRSTYEALYPNMVGENLTTSMFCVLDAMIFTRHFAQRTKALYDKVLMGANGIFGHGIHFWRRTEYQMRGAPHCHGVLWIKDAPTIKTNSKEEVINFVDRHITCRIPDPLVEPRLWYLVDKFQKHTCTSTCKTQKKVGGKIKRYCRFGFPYEPQGETSLTDKSGYFDDPLIRKKSYYLRRLPESVNINPYNSSLLLIWNGNIDVQFLGEMSLSHLEYITGYVVKGESKSKMDDFSEISTNFSKKDAMKMAMQMLQMRELGMPEIYDRLLGQHLYYASCSVNFLNNNDTKNRVRMVKPLDTLRKIAEGEITEPNLYDVYYPNRSSEMESFSLFTVFTSFQYFRTTPQTKNKTRKKGQQQDLNVDNEESDGEEQSERAEEDLNQGISRIYLNNPESPFCIFPKGTIYACQKSGGCFKARVKPVLARFYLPDLTDVTEDDERTEDYFRRLLFMFKPWRCEDQDLLGNFASYAEAWADFWEKSPPVTKSGLQQILDRTQEMYDAAKKRREEEHERRERLRDLEVEDVDGEIGELPVPQRVVSNLSLTKEISELNSDQKAAFDAIVEELKERLNNNKEDLENFLVSGYAGTGKSKLINVLANYVTLKYGKNDAIVFEPAVLLAAPTGLAAMHISGSTIHSLVKLEVEHGRMASYEALNPQSRSELTFLFKNVKLLIIDEISMVSNLLLLKLSRRLQEINANDLPFGGVFLVVFGDFLQLEPVRVPPVFMPVRGYQVRQIFKSIPYSLNLWELMFSYRELTINMRQREDLAYSDVLNRIRIGSPSNEDYRKLLNRFITLNDSWDHEEQLPKPATMDESVDYFMNLLEKDPHSIAVFAYTKVVTAFNSEVLKKRGFEIISLESHDESVERVHKKGTLFRPWLKRGMRRLDILKKKGKPSAAVSSKIDDTKKAGGLVKTLNIQIGCRLMLTRNIDVANKLVNGAMGTLLSMDDSSLTVKFDHLAVPEKIVRARALFNVGPAKQGARSQFPVTLAYALTIHKCQGVSVDNVMTDLYDLFCAGQGYVALSRSRTLEGVHLINFHPDSLYASESAIREYNRLRSTIKKDPLDKCNDKPSMSKLFPKKDKNWQDNFLQNKSELSVTALISRKRKKPGPRTSKPNEQEQTRVDLIQTNDRQQANAQPPAKRNGRGRPRKAETTVAFRLMNSAPIANKRPTRERRRKTGTSKNTSPLRNVSAAVQASSKTLRTISDASTLAKKTTLGRPRKNVVLPLRTDSSYNQLLLRNPRNYCFANSTVQLLRRLWKGQYTESADVDVFTESLFNLIDGNGCMSVGPLLNLAENSQYNDGEQHDVPAFMLHLLYIMRDLITETFTEVSASYKIVRKCKSCNVETETTTVQPLFYVSDEGGRTTTFNEAIKAADEGVTEVQKQCAACSPQENTAHEERAKNITNRTKYLLVAMPLFYHRPPAVIRNRKNFKPPLDNEFMFENNWTPIAAIEHIGGTPNSGHYRAWIKENSENGGEENWYLFDDDQVTQVSDLNSDQRKGRFYVYAFEKNS